MMLSRTLRISKHLRSSQAAAVGCTYLRSAFASQSEAFANEADQFVKAAAKLKGKPDRAAQVKAFAESKEAAQRIAEKMSGEAIDWQKEETKARNNLKRKMMEWGKCMAPCCQHAQTDSRILVWFQLRCAPASAYNIPNLLMIGSFSHSKRIASTYVHAA